MSRLMLSSPALGSVAMPISMTRNLGYQMKPVKVFSWSNVLIFESPTNVHFLFGRCFFFHRHWIEFLRCGGSWIRTLVGIVPLVGRRRYHVPLLSISRWKLFSTFWRHNWNSSNLRYVFIWLVLIFPSHWNFRCFSGSRHEGRVTNPALRPTTTTTRSPRIPGKPETPTKTPTKKPIHPPKPHPRPPHGGRKPNTCDTTYDAISIIRRELFIFKDRVNKNHHYFFEKLIQFSIRFVLL